MIKDKESTLKITTDEIEKKFGKGAIMRLGESTALNVEAIPTGALPLDVALGIGGVPRGRIVEIYGPDQMLCRFEDAFLDGGVYLLHHGKQVQAYFVAGIFVLQIGADYLPVRTQLIPEQYQ